MGEEWRMSSHIMSYRNLNQGRKEQAGYAAEVWRPLQTIFDRRN
jgi:hypothetical protein